MIKRALNSKVLEELGYEIKTKKSTFLFMEHISYYLYKDGNLVTKLYIPDYYKYKDEEYNITSISSKYLCRFHFEQIIIHDTIEYSSEDLYKNNLLLIFVNIDNEVISFISYDSEGVSYQKRPKLIGEKGKAKVDSNGNIKGKSYFSIGFIGSSNSNSEVSIGSDGLKTLSTNLFTSPVKLMDPNEDYW